MLLLEDVRTAQARLRQEKLAAMGRVSAGIAHEIRNPLAAIAQANALLLEDALPEPQQRLARMVADNVARLKRLVDEVMEVAPGTAPLPSVIDATAEVAAAAADWARTAGLDIGPGWPPAPGPADGAAARGLRPGAPAPRAGQPARQRQAPWQRRARAPSACAWRRATTGSALLLVDSDGPPIAQEVERYLFEPFFSTRSRGSGLGLYICRELCERYGASIEYRLRPDAPAQPVPGASCDARPRCPPKPKPQPPPDRMTPATRQQPAGRRRRARSAHAVRTDAGARRLRGRDRGQRRGSLGAAVRARLQRGDHRHAAARRHRPGAAAAAGGGAARARRPSSSPPTARPRARSRRSSAAPTTT